ncbi:M24 family metallopeptidase [Plantibacter sp. RU18]|uniref:M24 family metallopeptidase n=1 Tax=Plantibacter sp. RU18 TaxID=3158143 RepID=UPI003D35A770
MRPSTTPSTSTSTPAARAAVTTTARVEHGGRPAPDEADRRRKHERVITLLESRGAHSLILRSAAAISWYLDGSRVHVSLAADPIVAVVVSLDDAWLVATSNEVDRLRTEELPDIRIVTVPWHPPIGSVLPSGHGVLEESEVAEGIRAVRASLLPAEIARFRSLGREATTSLEALVEGVEESWTERAVAAEAASGLVAAGIDPLVLLVAGSERLAHRHPLPTEGELGARAMVVVCGRRDGLIVNVTRWFDAGGAPAEPFASDMRRIRAVERAYLDATVPGASLGGILRIGSAAYAEQGFAPDEWTKHHQGGAAGYAGRDPRATPGATDEVQLWQAFAWNPTAPGVKVEETVLVTPSGLEVLTTSAAKAADVEAPVAG